VNTLPAPHRWFRWSTLAPEELAASLHALLGARLGVLFLLLGATLLRQIFRREASGVDERLLTYVFLGVAFAFSLGVVIVQERLTPRPWIALVQFAFDGLVASIWIGLHGHETTLFALLYLVQILIAALTFYQSGALLAAGISALGYGTVLLATTPVEALTVWLVYTTLFATLGLAGGYLSGELRRTTASLEDKSRAMAQLQEFHERILRDLPTGLLTIDHAGVVHFVNPAAATILGRKEGELVGRRLGDAYAELLPFFGSVDARSVGDADADADAKRFLEEELSATGSEAHPSYFVERRSKTGTARLQQRVEIGAGREARILRGDVAELEPEAGFGALLGEATSGGRVLLFQDVTALVHLEEKVRQSEKLAAVGQLAAGIAHEIRNPLAGMSASLEMLHSAMPEGPEGAENKRLMEIALREIERLNGLVSEFLDFVKPERIQPKAVRLGALLEEVVSNVSGARSSKDVEFSLQLDAKAVAAGAEEKLRQVAFNLVVNAVQATVAAKRPGKVEVGCKVVSPQRVMFWVTDDGIGMSEETLAHLYEPFFTTKERGTGLGLATAYKIVEAHHGEICVDSKEGRGSRFEVLLPSA
jgi:two-component system sensor histidine kinase PilS (NtrC family)